MPSITRSRAGWMSLSLTLVLAAIAFISTDIAGLSPSDHAVPIYMWPAAVAFPNLFFWWEKNVFDMLWSLSGRLHLPSVRISSLIRESIALTTLALAPISYVTGRLLWRLCRRYKPYFVLPAYLALSFLLFLSLDFAQHSARPQKSFAYNLFLTSRH